MSCIGSDKDGYDGLPHKVCRYCVHLLDEHDAEGNCLVCDKVLDSVLAAWNRGEGNPPAGFVPTPEIA